ncbi:MAG: AMP-binding protein [Candidatus Glassbacteria bacterium]|nr:AMP-binding protein [Candidatus Glassbacteria bacterium]
MAREYATSSIATMIAASADAFPSRPAVIEYGPDGPAASWTYAELHGAACRFAARLRAEPALEPGGRVVVSGPNSGRWVAACLGVHLAGMTVVPMDTDYSDTDRDNIVAFVEPSAVVCSPTLKEGFSRCRLVIDLESIAPADLPGDFAPTPLAVNRPFSIVFTSGSTDTPKGVILTEANFLHNVTILQTFGKMISSSDKMLSLLPLHHVYAFTVTMLLPLTIGAGVVFPASLKPADIGSAARGERVTIMAVVPQVINSLHNRVIQEVKTRSLPAQAVFKLMLAVGSIGIERGWRPGRWLFAKVHRRFGRLRFFACGGAKLDTEVHRTVAALGFRIVEAYGLSETAPIVTINHPDRPVFGSVGKPVPEVELKLAESGGGIEDREVWVRGPNVMAGYWKLPDETARAFEDGWFRTGDLGRLDSDGNLFLTGRSKEVIVMPSGKNVYPGEVEKIYEQTDLVEEVCICLTVHDGREHLTAVVVPSLESIRRRKVSSIFSEVKFELENVGLRLPSYQRVTRIVLTRDPLPRTRLGKLQRFKVIQRIEQEPAGGTEAESAAEGDPGDRLLSFTGQRLKLDKIPTGRENLETDLGLDSLSKLDFISAAEDEFGLSLSDEEAATLFVLDDFRQFIERDSAEAETVATLPEKPLEQLVDMGDSRFWNVVRWWARLKLRITLGLFFRAGTTGVENLPKDRPFLLAPNHVSYADGLVVHIMVPGWLSRRMFSVATAEIFDRWPFAQISFRGRIIKTGTLETAARSLQNTLRLLELGYPVCVFPEGRRSIDGRVDEPKPGLGLLAEKAGVPVVPVYLDGTNAFLSRSNPGFHFSRLQVNFLPPIAPSGGKDNILEQWYRALSDAEAENERS